MLQFLIGVSTLNVSWLFAGLFGGLRFYNSPPLFFVGGIMLLVTGFYSFRLRPDMLLFLFVIGSISLVGTYLSGMDTWHLRQGVAFIVAATIWVYVYQTGWRQDIYSLQTSKTILAVYLIYLVLTQSERVLGTAILPYLVSCIAATGCGENLGYFASGRQAFFSAEPANAVLAITATVMPYLCANAIIKRNWPALGLMGLGLFLLFFSEGLTALSFLAFSVVFFCLPQLAVISVPVLMALIVVISANISYVLGDKDGVADLVQSWFGGIYARVDQGIESGSYLTRVMNWLIGARAFLSAPITGLGIGGTQSYFFSLNDAGYYIVLGLEQSNAVNGDSSVDNVPMVVRIPAEIGSLGIVFLTYYGWKAFRLVFEPGHDDLMLHYAYLYSLGAMLLSFIFAAELFNPCITGFIALLAQTLRARQAHARAHKKPVTAGAFLVPQLGTA